MQRYSYRHDRHTHTQSRVSDGWFAEPYLRNIHNQDFLLCFSEYEPANAQKKEGLCPHALSPPAIRQHCPVPMSEELPEGGEVTHGTVA